MWGEVPCAGRNAEITRYTIIYYPTSDPSDRGSGVVMVTSNRVFTARGLIPRTDYTIEVRPDHIDFLGGVFIASVSSATITITTGVPQGNSHQCSNNNYDILQV